MNKYRNKVIKCKNLKHRDQILEFFKRECPDQEEEISNCKGTSNEENQDLCIYYGFIGNTFDYCSLHKVQHYGCEIIELPEESPTEVKEDSGGNKIYVNHQYDNCVIDCLTNNHGIQILQFWRSVGVDVNGYTGASSREHECVYTYYGLIDGRFDNYAESYVKKHKVNIIDIPDELCHEYDNCVIKCLTHEHGRQIIDFWKRVGVDVKEYDGNCCVEDGDSYVYYGLIKGEFDNYHINSVIENKASIIELPNKNPNFNNKKQVSNEYDTNQGKSIRVQKVTPTITTGQRIVGRRVSGRASLAAITIGHLSFKEISVRG